MYRSHQPARLFMPAAGTEQRFAKMSSALRQKPNILVTGTPGTGKTSTCEQVAQLTGFKHINVGDWVREKELHSGWDDEFKCFEIDEDKVCQRM